MKLWTNQGYNPEVCTLLCINDEEKSEVVVDISCIFFQLSS